MTKEKLQEIYNAATDTFYNGLYIKSDIHKCGWDFLSFDKFKCLSDIFNEQLVAEDFNENYYFHEYEDLTLGEILDIVGDDGWCFEISGTDDLR